ncbi:hypothetical protein M427DRAFT_35671 [Gonapodya prolifera JEL478]|uniref:Uncharacterized protein n=1 Tax=Gonapodya prolifera (strain JEL478) TaxID=1344416 RepID=A0A139A3Z9_GONPJ|nr:hypothetical protein M427DRAFT_35671 [Gonapodya prolifera JEL478]|eukprot:KXS11547.1 hypothetical protein M427DRAFT_35671 [Gonapodya prolifera JEL478]
MSSPDHKAASVESSSAPNEILSPPTRVFNYGTENDESGVVRSTISDNSLNRDEAAASAVEMCYEPDPFIPNSTNVGPESRDLAPTEARSHLVARDDALIIQYGKSRWEAFLKRLAARDNPVYKNDLENLVREFLEKETAPADVVNPDEMVGVSYLVGIL